MKQFLYLLLCVCLFSCSNNKKNDATDIQEKPKLSIAQQHVFLTEVEPDFEKEIKNWKELKTVNSFIKKFEKVSSNEALSNALELRDLVINLKDSITPRIFDIPSFKARINVLHNETLRLADLTFIPSITAEEVNLQVDKTINAFSSVNSKINTILSKKRFEDAIDIKIDFIGIDSTKMDSVSRKSIDQKKKDALLKNQKSYEGPPVIQRYKKKKKS